MKLRVEEQENLTLRQEMVDSLTIEGTPVPENVPQPEPDRCPKIVGVRVRGGAEYRAQSVIITTGTFLQAIMHTGEAKTQGGRAGEGTTGTMSDSFRELGFQLERFKTGTPARLNGRT